MLKKIFICIISCMSLLLSAFDSGQYTIYTHTDFADYNSLIDKVLTQSPAYKKILSEYNRQELLRSVYKFRWITRPLIDSGYAGNLYTEKGAAQRHALKNTLILSQSLPAGISCQIQTAHFFGININEKIQNKALIPSRFEYDFDSSLALSVPLYAASPFLLSSAIKSELYTCKLLSEAAILDLEAAEKRIKTQAVNHISSYLLLQERIILEEKLQILRDKEAEADTALWEMGKLSSFELSERTTKRYEQYLVLLQFKQNFSVLRQNLYDLGLTEDDMPLSIDSWLRYWENFIDKNKTKNGLETEAEEKRLTLAFYNKAEEGLLSLPKINLSVRIFPLSTFTAAGSSGTALDENSNSFTSSIRHYWNNVQKWQCTFHASIKISLFPFDREYLVPKEFAIEQQNYDNACKTLNVYRKNRKIRYEDTIALLRKLSDKALMEKQDADNKMLTASSLKAQGYLSETSFAYQKLNALLAENNYKEVRLRFISAVLEGY